jgi:hypothetical protein
MLETIAPPNSPANTLGAAAKVRKNQGSWVYKV